jgi:hypothetical protein
MFDWIPLPLLFFGDRINGGFVDGPRNNLVVLAPMEAN